MSRANNPYKILRAAHRRMERAAENERKTGERTREFFNAETRTHCQLGAINGEHFKGYNLNDRNGTARLEALAIIQGVYLDMLMDLPDDDPRLATPSNKLLVGTPKHSIMQLREGKTRLLSVPKMHDHFWTSDELLHASKLALMRAEDLVAERQSTI